MNAELRKKSMALNEITPGTLSQLLMFRKAKILFVASLCLLTNVVKMEKSFASKLVLWLWASRRSQAQTFPRLLLVLLSPKRSGSCWCFSTKILHSRWSIGMSNWLLLKLRSKKSCTCINLKASYATKVLLPTCVVSKSPCTVSSNLLTIGSNLFAISLPKLVSQFYKRSMPIFHQTWRRVVSCGNPCG